MGKKLILKLTLSSVAIILTVSILSTTVLAWGPATHTYLAKELGNRCGIMNMQEMYGSVVPDMFNVMFGDPDQPYLWYQTHYNFMKVVDRAKFGRRKAFAYGFASHNEAWGADFTAHIKALTIDGDNSTDEEDNSVDEEKGYVIIKTKKLAPKLVPGIEAFLTAKDIPHTPELVEELALRLANPNIEFAVDVLVSENEDRHIGIRMLLAARFRSLFIPTLLSRAYARDFADYADITLEEAILKIVWAEREFRGYMEVYGGILTQENAAELMVDLGAQLAKTMLQKEYGIYVDPPRDIMETCLFTAIDIVKDDYSDELEATLEYVDEQLKAHGIETCHW